MFNKLLALYKNQIIYPVDKICEGYYYFYKTNNHLDIFAIKKDISLIEYELIKSNFIEKNIYDLNKDGQNIYEYLLENKAYPFDKKAMRFIIYNQYNDEITSNMIKDLLPSIQIINLLNYQIAFYPNQLDLDFKNIFQALSQDLSQSIYIHKGLIFNSEMSGRDLMAYIYACFHSNILQDIEYSETPDLIFKLTNDDYFEVISIIKNQLFNSILQDIHQIELIRVFLKNNLNVSLSAKLLYMHRNSLLNRLDNIYKETGFNIQTFKDASALQMIMKNIL